MGVETNLETDKLTEQDNHPVPGNSRPGQPGVNTRKQKPKLGSKDPPTIGVMFVDQTMGVYWQRDSRK